MQLSRDSSACDSLHSEALCLTEKTLFDGADTLCAWKYDPTSDSFGCQTDRSPHITMQVFYTSHYQLLVFCLC